MKTIAIDGIGINAEHFGAMTEEEAVKRMIDDGFVPGNTPKEKEAWAKKVYAKIKDGNNRPPDTKLGKA